MKIIVLISCIENGFSAKTKAKDLYINTQAKFKQKNIDLRILNVFSRD